MQPLDTLPPPAAVASVEGGLSEQQRAFYLEDSHCLCIACPGAGKTRTVIAKVARLCEAWGPSSVMAITFTRAGAKELRERLARRLGLDIAKRIRAFTFHGLAYRHLSSRQSVQLISNADQHGLLARARERVESDCSLEKLGEIIGSFKRQLTVQAPREGSAEYGAWQVYLEYQRAMAAHSVMDMDDLMLACLRAYQARVLKPYPVRAMLIDEFQDVDEVQLGIVLEYAKRGTTIHAVGDDDQSIYGFRAGLGYAGMRRLEQELKARVCHLDANYRCAPEIVAAASQVIANNQQRMTKQLVSAATVKATVELRPFDSSFDEADAIIDRYKGLASAGSTMAVLARTNSGLDTVELAAISRQIPVRRVGDVGFLQRRHVANILSTIRLGVSPDDRLALVSSLNASGVSTAGVATLETRLTRSEPTESALDVLYEVDSLAALDKQDATLVRECRQTLATWIEAGQVSGAPLGHDRQGQVNPPLGALLRRFMEREPADWRRHDIHTVERILTERLQGPLRDRIKTIDSWTRRSKRDESLGSAGIHLMTAHSAKGLEFDAVWVVGCNERAFPYEGCDLEEERRLFYVALTRARSWLAVSYIAEGKRERSRFVWEMGLPPMDRTAIIQ